MIVNAMMGRLHVRNSDQTGQSGVFWGGEVVGSRKNPGCLGYVGDYTTQFYRDYKDPCKLLKC